MPQLFYRMLQRNFPGGFGKYSTDIYNPEMMRVRALKIGALPSMEKIEGIARTTLEGLEHQVHSATMDATGVSRGDCLIAFPSSGHFIGLTTDKSADLSLQVDFFASISIGWRGRIPMTSDERLKYIDMLKSYFALNV